MKRGLKGFAFLVSGLVLGIIGATASVTAIALSAVGMAKEKNPQCLVYFFNGNV